MLSNKLIGMWFCFLVAGIIVSCQSHTVPSWYRNLPYDDQFVYAASTVTSRDPQLAIQRAQVEGRAKIAEHIEEKYKAMEDELVQHLPPERAVQVTRIFDRLLTDFHDRELQKIKMID